MDIKELLDLSHTANAVSGIILYVAAGIGALFLILFIVWLLFKISNYIRRKKGHMAKDEPSDEEQLFGD